MEGKDNNRPKELKSREYRYDAFGNGKVLLQKKKDRLPAMGWNSWNAFGSGNTEALTKAMADAMVELELDKLGYRYVVLDDGCYKSERIDGKLSNETGKFPGGFRELSDYIHAKGLKFGMYNDIGTNLCAGAAVGTCGHEDVDARSYLDWGVDFLKVDNCYYLWDNATFSEPANAKYVYAPDIKAIRITGKDFCTEFSAVRDGILQGSGVEKKEDCVTNIGTFDGTGPGPSPVGEQSGELWFYVTAPKAGSYRLTVTCVPGQEVGRGSWLQIAVGTGEDSTLVFDDFVTGNGECAETAEGADKNENRTVNAEKAVCVTSAEIELLLQEGENVLRLMNHRRQENTLSSYAALLEGLNAAKADHDVVLSICEWGKTQPQNWGYKVGDSWRILNDITFRVGADGDPGVGAWTDDYTPSVISQYNKAVIMDEFAGPDKGWNDPDMLMVGMNGLTETMYKTHMAMWCMMNSPLMLGLDLRRVKKGDALWQIIANRELIALNQDALGVQAKRIFSTVPTQAPDREYIREYDRVDILAKPLADGSVALAFFNISQSGMNDSYGVDVADILKYIGPKMKDSGKFAGASGYQVRDLWSGETTINTTGRFEVDSLEACGNVTIKITPGV